MSIRDYSTVDSYEYSTVFQVLDKTTAISGALSRFTDKAISCISEHKENSCLESTYVRPAADKNKNIHVQLYEDRNSSGNVPWLH